MGFTLESMIGGIPQVIVSVMGIIKGGDGYCMHLLPLINGTQSGIKIWFWLEILVDLLKAKGRTNYPAFF